MRVTPNTYASLGTGVTAAGALSTAVGSYHAARTNKRNAELQALASEESARLAEWEAKDAVRRGERVEDASRLKFGRVRSAQNAALASSGFDLGAGSALDLLDDTEIASDIEAANIRENTGREANAAQNQARQFRNQARFQRAGAAGISPNAAAAQSLITGAGQVASSWYSYNQRTRG